MSDDMTDNKMGSLAVVTIQIPHGPTLVFDLKDWELIDSDWLSIDVSTGDISCNPKRVTLTGRLAGSISCSTDLQKP